MGDRDVANCGAGAPLLTLLFRVLVLAWGVALVPQPAEAWVGVGAHLPADTLVVAAFESLVPAKAARPGEVERRSGAEESFSPSGWIPLSFGGDRGFTHYSPAVVAERSCLVARARAGGSGLLNQLVVLPDAFSRIQWSWWVEGPVAGGNVRKKEGDDFAARIYVNFRFEPDRAGVLHRLKHRLAGRRFGGEAPGKALVYVWGNEADAGTVTPNAYTDQAMVVVVRSGEEGAGEWWTEERDFVSDFLDAFGHPPPALHSIAIMTDADDTGASASACYGNIVLF